MIRPEIRLIVTNRCNLGCFYCFNENQEAKGPYSELYLDRVDVIAKIVSDLGISHIHLTGGEPSLRQDLDKIVGRLRYHDIKDVALTTNGTRLTEEYIKSIKNAGLNEMHVHLPSLKRNDYLRITKCDLDPKRIADVVADASNQGLKIRFNTPVSELNWKSVKELLDYAYDNLIGVALMQIVPSRDYLGKYRIIEHDKIKDLFFKWAKSKDFKIKKDSSYEDFGISYNVNSQIKVQVLPTDRIHNPEFDNRVWIGTDGEHFLFSYSLDQDPFTTDSNGLKFLIKLKYDSYKNHNKYLK